MEEEPNLFNKFTFFIDQNLNGVRIGVYGVAFTGLAIAIRSVRPFSRFSKPSDIPNHFIQQRTKLKGFVERVEPNGSLLMVQHRPLIRLTRSKGECLPVKVAGVKISGNGLNWLQSIVAGNNITFIPVFKHKDCVQCEVNLPQAIKDKKIKNLNIGPALVAVGFGSIAPIEKSLINNSEYLSYYRQLTAAEQAAIRKQMGLWYYAKPTKEISMKLFQKIISLFRQKQKVQKRESKIDSSKAVTTT